MLINLGDMTNGMGIVFIREFMDTSQRISCYEDDLLFREGDAANNFFTLIQGEFRLTIGASVQHVFTVRQPGDIFGWSSLVGRKTYSATAVCTNLSEVLRFDRDLLLDLLYKQPGSGFFFFKKLSEIIGKRLLKSYRLIEGEKTLDYCQSGVSHLVIPQ